VAPGSDLLPRKMLLLPTLSYQVPPVQDNPTQDWEYGAEGRMVSRPERYPKDTAGIHRRETGPRKRIQHQGLGGENISTSTSDLPMTLPREAVTELSRTPTDFFVKFFFPFCKVVTLIKLFSLLAYTLKQDCQIVLYTDSITITIIYINVTTMFSNDESKYIFSVFFHCRYTYILKTLCLMLIPMVDLHKPQVISKI